MFSFIGVLQKGGSRRFYHLGQDPSFSRRSAGTEFPLRGWLRNSRADPMSENLFWQALEIIGRRVMIGSLERRSTACAEIPDPLIFDKSSS
jgi:hypothetical protein